MRNPFRMARRAAVEARRLHLRYWWVALVSLGFLPALLFSSRLLKRVVRADWSCSQISFSANAGYGYTGSSGEEVFCETIPGQLIVATAVLWAAPLFVLLTLLYLRRHARRHDDERGGHSGTAVEGGTGADRTAIFVRLTAILVGLANTLVIRDPRDVLASSGGQTLDILFGTSLLAVVAGLVASEVVLRLGRPALGGRFAARYGITLLGMCLGGALLGGSSLALGLLNNQPGIQYGAGGVPLLVYAALAYGLIAAVVGGVLGALEGLVLGFPLAAILGKLGRPQDRVRGSALPCLAS